MCYLLKFSNFGTYGKIKANKNEKKNRENENKKRCYYRLYIIYNRGVEEKISKYVNMQNKKKEN